jgi:hypothetical protein
MNPDANQPWGPSKHGNTAHMLDAQMPKEHTHHQHHRIYGPQSKIIWYDYSRASTHA